MVRSSVNLIILLIIVIFNSCIEEPILPPEPTIKLKSFGFKPATEPQDSLIIEIEFKDGDGDLGLVPFDTLPPYNEMDSVLKFDGSGYIKLEDKANPPYDTLPPYEPGRLCRYWETVVYRLDGTIHETVFYVNRNPHHFNFHAEIWVQQPDESYELYDFLDERCSPGLNSRFFPLNTTDKERPLEGILRFGAPLAWRFLFPTETLQLRIYVEDRQLNQSNVVKSRPFTLKEFINI